MVNITVKDLVNLQDNSTFTRDLSESELNLQGGGLFRRRRLTPPVVDVAPLAPVPDILIGFSVGFSI